MVEQATGRSEWIHDTIERLLPPGGTVVDIGCDHAGVTGDRTDTTYVDIRSLDEILAGISHIKSSDGNDISLACSIDPDRFVQADAANLPFSDKQFDLAILGDILEHMPAPVLVIREALRVAQSIIVTVPNEHDWGEGRQPFVNPPHREHPHIWYYTLDLLSNHLSSAGAAPSEIFKLAYDGWSFWVATYDGRNPSSTPNISSVYDKPEYWCGDIGYRPGNDGQGYRDFNINGLRAWYIQSKNPGRVLDLGCAMGYLVRRLRNQGVEAWGIDISQYALEHAPEETRQWLTWGNTDRLPWPDKFFDMVVSFALLEHLNHGELERAIKEIQRVSQRGIISVGYGDNPDFADDITHAIKENGDWWREKIPDVYEIHDDRNEVWMEIAKAAETEGKLRIIQVPDTEDTPKGVPVSPMAIAVMPEQPQYPTMAGPQQEGKLKIALTCSPFIQVPPIGYGGLERVVYDIAVPLAKMGHEVTVFAADGSHAEGCEVFTFGPPMLTVQCNWLQEEHNALEKSLEKLLAGKYDIIHTHDWFGLHYKQRLLHPELRICHTAHGHLNIDWWKTTPAPFPLNMFAISQWMRQQQDAHGFPSHVVYNGVDMDKYAYKAEKGGRLLFVGRIDTFKRPEVAIDVAKRLGVGLDICAGTFVQSDEFMKSISDQCDGQKIIWHQEPTQEKKVELMQNAMCLLTPSKMGEPFGLMNAEANACGTPAIGMNDGAIAEVIAEGVTGYVVNDINEMVEAVKKVGQIDPATCRKHVDDNFSREIMAKNYLAQYREILDGREW